MGGSDGRDQVGVDFVDVLFGIAVGEVFVGMAGANHHEVARWSALFVALVVIALSWIGYHKARKVFPPPLNFRDAPSMAQFGIDIAIIGVYFALVRHAETASGYHLVVQALLIAVAFFFYVLWDAFSIVLGDRDGGARLRNSLIWTTGFAAAVIILRWGWEPESSAPVVVIDVAYGIVLYAYRVRQEKVWKAPKIRPSFT